MIHTPEQPEERAELPDEDDEHRPTASGLFCVVDWDPWPCPASAEDQED